MASGLIPGTPVGQLFSRSSQPSTPTLQDIQENNLGGVSSGHAMSQLHPENSHEKRDGKPWGKRAVFTPSVFSMSRSPGKRTHWIFQDFETFEKSKLRSILQLNVLKVLKVLKVSKAFMSFKSYSWIPPIECFKTLKSEYVKL